MSAPTTPSRPSQLVIGLAVAGGLLLLVVVALVFLLIGRGTPGEPAAVGTETPVPTASATPSPTETAAVGQPEGDEGDDDGATDFTSFTADLQVQCDPTGEQPKPEITFSWSARNAVEAWYAPADQDAVENDYFRFPDATRGSQDDLTDEHLFPCNHDQYLDVTITLVAPDGSHVSKHVVYEDVNWGT